ncbi:MAG: L-histidine N(alpha)-methyltransferase [Cyanobacteria bacterium P01_D01_bin.115]
MPVQSQFPSSMPAADDNRTQSPQSPVLSRDRLVIEYRNADETTAALPTGQDVTVGLTHPPKTLPPKYFYDDQGSQLFEQITDLPEYYLTRTERQILETFAEAIATQVGSCDLVELGSGSASKTRILFDAYQRQGQPLRYVPVDVSGGILEESAKALLSDYGALTIHGLVSTYEAALSNLPATDLPRRLIAFIGSTLGNLSPQQAQTFFQRVSAALTPGDYFLLGVDLHKDTATLTAAYNDAQGVTAAFNLNMLSHLNWRFQGDFELSQFRHVAVYNEGDRQIEMYIESLVDQTVNLKALDLTASFAAGERLLSEISRKFDPEQLAQRLAAFGLDVTDTFTDEYRQFALLLCQKQ